MDLEELKSSNRYSSWSSSNGSFGGSFAPKDHPHKGWSGGGGGGYSGGVDGKPITYPESYICHILAGQFSSQMTLLPAKGGAS